MTQPAPSTLIEVFFQDSPEGKISNDIVFDEAEAQALVLDFYNSQLLTHQLSIPLLKDYQDCLKLQQNTPNLPFKSGYEIEKPTNENLTIPPKIATSASSKTQSHSSPTLSQPALEKLSFALQELLWEEKIHLPPGKVLQLLEQAQQLANTSSSYEHPKPLEATPHETVWLIQIGHEDLGLYLGNNYLDSAELSNQAECKVLLEDAQMLAEKYRAELKEHYFEHLPEGWRWTDVDKIMVKSGLFSHAKTPLMVALREAKSIKINGQLVAEFEFYESAFDDYVKHGLSQEDLLRLRVDIHRPELDVYLTVEEIINATQVKSNQWVCFDSEATELTINHVTAEASISSLLR